MLLKHIAKVPFKIYKVIVDSFWKLAFWAKLLFNNSCICFPFYGDGKLLYKSDNIMIDKSVKIKYRAYLSILGNAVFKVGQGTSIANDFVLSCVNHVEIGKYVLIADRVFISDSIHNYYDINVPIMHQGMIGGRVKIGDNCWIGINVSILRNVEIGNHSIIGANSVVSKDIPSYSVAAGVPAKIIKKYDEKEKKWVIIK